jgi:hypothetical protein
MRNTAQRNLIIAALSSDLGNVTVFGDEPLKLAQAKKLADDGTFVAIGRRTTTHHNQAGRATFLLEVTYRLANVDVLGISSVRFAAGVAAQDDLRQAYCTLAITKSDKVRADAQKLIALLHAEQDQIQSLIKKAA